MNNLPSTDIWRLIDNDPDSQHFNQYFRFDFSFFESTAIKITAKKYIWSNYITGSRAETSGISTTTLYNNPVLRARISSLRAVQIQSAQKNSAHRISEREKIRLLQQEIQNLKGDKKMLIEQLVEMEQLKAENKQLKELLSIRKLE